MTWHDAEDGFNSEHTKIHIRKNVKRMGKFGVRLKATVTETTTSAILSISAAESIILNLHTSSIQLFGDTPYY